MGFSLFDHFVVEDDMRRTASRKPLAVARKRAELRFGSFLNEASSREELELRKELIKNDLKNLVEGACKEHGYEDSESILASVESSLGVRTSRRPKMCPFHRELTDFSLSLGDPNAAINSLSQHMFSDSSCRGGYEGTCNWKADMLTQDFWDKRQEELDKARQEREQQWQVRNDGLPEDSSNLPEGTYDDFNSTNELETDYQGVDIEEALDAAPSAVGIGEGNMLEPAMSSVHKANQYVQKRGDQWCVIQKGTGKCLSKHDSKEDAEASFRAMEMHKHEGFVHEAVKPRGDKPVTGDSIEENTSPKMKNNSDDSYAHGLSHEPSGATMNKNKWTPESVPKPSTTNESTSYKTEGENTRWPTERQDITQPTNFTGTGLFEYDHRFEQTEMGGDVHKRESLPDAGFDDAGLNRDKTVEQNPDTRTWDKGYGSGSDVLEQQSPVTPDLQFENVLSSFISFDEAKRAINSFKS